MIEVHALTVTLGGRPVLSGLDAAFARGKITAIIGPNGAGKTSLIRALAGLIAPASGTIKIDGATLDAMPIPQRARQIGYLAQDAAPAWAVTARELVTLGRIPHRSIFAAPSESDEAAVDAALAATDTGQLSARTVDSLSGGELARVKLARVLAGDPDWILADEPLANLDPPHQRDVLALLRAAADGGKGVIVVLHQLDAALRLADAALLLKDGKAIAQGDKDDVIAPHPLREAFGMDFERVEGASGPALLPL